MNKHQSKRTLLNLNVPFKSFISPSFQKYQVFFDLLKTLFLKINLQNVFGDLRYFQNKSILSNGEQIQRNLENHNIHTCETKSAKIPMFENPKH